MHAVKEYYIYIYCCKKERVLYMASVIEKKAKILMLCGYNFGGDRVVLMDLFLS